MDGFPSQEKTRHRTRIAVSDSEPMESSSVHAKNARDSLTASVLKAVLCAGIGAFLFGYHLGVVNGPLDAIASDLGFAGDTVLQGSVVSSLLAGAAVGSLSGGNVADKAGRRYGLILASGVMIFGVLLSFASSSLSMMLAGRFVTGIAVGISSAVVPLYISEVSPTSIRGALGSLNQLAICLGILGALCVNVVLPATSWRLMFSISTIPALVLAIGMMFSPETPRWLAGKGQRSSAKEVMMALWGEVDETLDTMPSQETGHQLKQTGLFSGRNLRVILVSCTLFLFQQFSGINAIIYFSTKVFSEAGTTNMTLASAAVGATNVFGTIIASFLMDHSGRKQLLTLSFLGMGIAMALMVLGFSSPLFASISGLVALFGTLGYILAFGLGGGPVPGLLVPEIASAEIRGRAVSLAYTTHWVTNFFIGQMFLPAINQFGISKVYSFFSLVCFGAILFIKKFIVETKGRSLEEIEKAMSV